MMHLNDPDILQFGLSETAGAWIHPNAIVEAGANVGPGTRVWAFAHVLPGAVIGADCNVCDHTFVEGDVRVGDRVTIKCGVYLWAGTRIDDDVFLGPNVTFTNDRRPRSRRRPPKFEGVTVHRGASVGAGAILLPGIEIGAYAMIGAGAVVTKDVPSHALVRGNPARQVGTVCKCGRRIREFDNERCARCEAASEMCREDVA